MPSSSSSGEEGGSPNCMTIEDVVDCEIIILQRFPSNNQDVVEQNHDERKPKVVELTFGGSDEDKDHDDLNDKSFVNDTLVSRGVVGLSFSSQVDDKFNKRKEQTNVETCRTKNIVKMTDGEFYRELTRSRKRKELEVGKQNPPNVGTESPKEYLEESIHGTITLSGEGEKTHLETTGNAENGKSFTGEIDVLGSQVNSIEMNGDFSNKNDNRSSVDTENDVAVCKQINTISEKKKRNMAPELPGVATNENDEDAGAKLFGAGTRNENNIIVSDGGNEINDSSIPTSATATNTGAKKDLLEICLKSKNNTNIAAINYGAEGDERTFSTNDFKMKNQQMKADPEQSEGNNHNSSVNPVSVNNSVAEFKATFSSIGHDSNEVIEIIDSSDSEDDDIEVVAVHNAKTDPEKPVKKENAGTRACDNSKNEKSNSTHDISDEMEFVALNSDKTDPKEPVNDENAESTACDGSKDEKNSMIDDIDDDIQVVTFNNAINDAKEQIKDENAIIDACDNLKNERDSSTDDIDYGVEVVEIKNVMTDSKKLVTASDACDRSKNEKNSFTEDMNRNEECIEILDQTSDSSSDLSIEIDTDYDDIQVVPRLSNAEKLEMKRKVEEEKKANEVRMNLERKLSVARAKQAKKVAEIRREQEKNKAKTLAEEVRKQAMTNAKLIAIAARKRQSVSQPNFTFFNSTPKRPKNACKGRYQPWAVDIDPNAYQEQQRLFRESAARVKAQENVQRLLRMSRQGTQFYSEAVKDLTTLPKDHYKWSDPYSRLGVPQKSRYALVKRNYRKLCLLYHPDKARSSDNEAQARFQGIKEAYEQIKESLGL